MEQGRLIVYHASVPPAGKGEDVLSLSALISYPGARSYVRRRRGRGAPWGPACRLPCGGERHGGQILQEIQRHFEEVQRRAEGERDAGEPSAPGEEDGAATEEGTQVLDGRAG